VRTFEDLLAVVHATAEGNRRRRERGEVLLTVGDISQAFDEIDHITSGEGE
jgi:hypothetical protein